MSSVLQRTSGVHDTAPDALGSGNSRRSPQSFEELEIPDAFRAVIEKELTAGENMLWLGRPSRNPLVQPRQKAFLFIGLGLISFGLGIALIGGLHFSLVFAAVFGVIGLAFLIPWLIDPTKSCRTCYVVTNRRAILVEMSATERGLRAHSYLPHQLLGLERQENPAVAGAGDLIFEYIFVLPGQSIDLKSGAFLTQGAGFGRDDVAKRVPRGFFFLDNAREVEQLIRTALLGQLENALDQAGVANENIPSSDISAVAAAGTANCREDGLIAPELKAKALGGLDPSEKVVWIGQPVGKLIFWRSIGYLAGGSILALAALIWLAGTIAPQKPANAGAQKKLPALQQAGKNAKAPPKVQARDLLPPGGLLLASLGLVSVPFLRRHYGGRTCYALTNRRALVYKEGLFGPTRESYTPLEVTGMRRSNSWLQSGSGDLIFRTVKVLKSTRTGTGASSQRVKTTHYGFLAITDVEGVEKLVRATLIDRFVDKLQQADSL